MGGLSYAGFRSSLNDLVDAAPRYGYRTTKHLDTDDTWLATWATDQLYVLVQASLADANLKRTLLDVHAGGAYAAQSSTLLFQTVCTATWRFDFGGPWARVAADGTVAYGWRSRLPSELFGEANMSDAFGFVLGMVDAFGHAAGTLATELLPTCGGRLMRDSDPQAFPALLSGLLPPDPSVPAPTDSPTVVPPPAAPPPAAPPPASPPPAAPQPAAPVATASPTPSNTPTTAYRCGNRACAQYGQPLDTRQCPVCHHYAPSS